MVPQLANRALKPLVLFSFVTGQPAVVVAEAMAALGLDVPLLVSHGNANPRFLKLISHTAVNLIVPSGKTMVLDTISEDDPCRKAVTDFNARHQLRYGEPANYYSAELADAIDLLTEGVRRTGNDDSEKLREAVEGIHGFSGMQGKYDLSPIDHYGTGIEQIVLLTAKNGAWHCARLFPPRTSSTIFMGIRKAGSSGMWRSSFRESKQTARATPCPKYRRSRRYWLPEPGSTVQYLGSDPYFTAKLFCQQKLEMMKSVRAGSSTGQKEALSRLLIVSILRHYETPETLRLAVLELFFALFDAALE